MKGGVDAGPRAALLKGTFPFRPGRVPPRYQGVRAWEIYPVKLGGTAEHGFVLFSGTETVLFLFSGTARPSHEKGGLIPK